MRRDLIVPKGKCPLDVLTEQGEKIFNTWIVFSASIASQDFPSKGVITKSDRRFTNRDYFKLETAEQYPKHILAYYNFRDTGWCFLKDVLKDVIVKGKSDTYYDIGFVDEPEGIIFVEKHKVSFIKRTDLIVPKDRWSLDILSEQGKKLRNTWVFLHDSVMSQLGTSKGAIIIHQASSPENMYMEWEKNGKHPEAKITYSDSDDIYFGGWRLLIHASVKKNTFCNIEKVNEPEEVIFVKMEGA